MPKPSLFGKIMILFNIYVEEDKNVLTFTKGVGSKVNAVRVRTRFLRFQSQAYYPFGHTESLSKKNETPIKIRSSEQWPIPLTCKPDAMQ